MSESRREAEERALSWALVLASIIFVVVRAWPRLRDGAETIRMTYAVMFDEGLILDRVSQMLQRGDLWHGVSVYPGLYPYFVAGVRLAVGLDAPVETFVFVVRLLSMVTMVLGMVATYLVWARLAESRLAAALLVAFLGFHPETVLWAGRVHPDAMLVLFDHLALGLLGIAVKEGRWHLLYVATAFAALSAGAKLVGGFIAPAIGVALLIAHGRRPARFAGEALLHAALFIGLFLLANPLLVTRFHDVLWGFKEQHRQNVTIAVEETWAQVFAGARGLGWVGLALAFLGLADTVRRKFPPELRAWWVFLALYLAYLFFATKLAVARYAFPAMWPLLFLGIAAVVRWMPKARFAHVALVGVLGVPFVVLDLAPRLRATAEHDGWVLAADTRAVLDLLSERQRGRPPLILFAGPDVVAPDAMDRRVTWEVDALPFPSDADIAVLDGWTKAGKNADALRRGDGGFVRTATIGRFTVFERPASPTAEGT